MYVPVPPDAIADHVTLCPVEAVVGETEQVTVGMVETLTELLHGVDEVETPPDVAVTLAVFVPVIEYDFETVCVVPVSESVPVHE